MIITEINLTLWCDAGDHPVTIAVHDPCSELGRTPLEDFAKIMAFRRGWHFNLEPTCPDCVARRNANEQRKNYIERVMFGDG